MPCFSRFMLTAGGLLLATTAATAQSPVSAQRRSVADLVLVPEVQTELALRGDDYLLATFSLVAFPAGDNTFAARQLRLGYEHFWTKKWSYGATLRLPGGDYGGYGDFIGLVGNVVPGALLRHTSQVGTLNFGQRLGVEYALTTGSRGPDPSRALTRLRLDLERQFPVGEKTALRPRLAYEAVAYLRLQRDEDQLKERVVDFGSLRAELGVRLSPHFDFTPYMAWQTNYINSLFQYDAQGHQTAGGRVNLVTPVVGLEMRLTLLSKPGVGTERQQLPTQH